MYFQLKQLILWPRHETEPRVLNFRPGVVNVISGASKTGKSAVIPIIDYCLGSEKCAIPVGVIRERCAWFGILIETLEGLKLIARREPGDQQSTGDMFLLEGIELSIPERILEKNTNVDAVKVTLNRLAGLTNLDFEPNPDVGYNARPNFRDLMAFMFQPQNIVANPDVMFFKADTTEHREKLRTIFPYVLGAVTPEVLQARWELERLQRALRRKESELNALAAATGRWRLEAQAWMRQAIDLGLLSAATVVPDDWPSILAVLRKLAESNARRASLSLQGIEATLDRLRQLRNSESEVAAQVSQHRQHLNEIRRLIDSSEAYGGAMRMQRERLAVSEWLRTRELDVQDSLALLGDSGQDNLRALYESLEGIELRLQSHPRFSDTLDKELVRRRAAAEVALDRLNGIRQEIAALERESDEVREAIYRSDQVERFLGRLEQALQLYDNADQTSDLREEVASLKDSIAALQGTIADSEIGRRLRNALRRVEAIIARMIARLDAEWPNAPVTISVENLTVKVLRDRREDYLWEIVSGANWLAYHVALTAALQWFFLKQTYHPVPALLVYDQPSQVYFPKTRDRTPGAEASDWRDEDVEAVRKVFSLLGSLAVNAEGCIQIIVLDHAFRDVWGDLPGVELTAEWRGAEKLVPTDWI